MRDILLICIGNEFRRDDRIAWLLADQLSEEKNVRVVKHSGEGTALLDLWSENPNASIILVDAMKTAQKPGTMMWWPNIDAIPAGCGFRCSSHQFSVLEAIALAKELGRLPRQMAVLGIEGLDFQFGTELSRDVLAVLPQAERRLREEIQQCMK